MLDDLVSRDPTPGSAVMVPMAALSTGEALGIWIMAGVFERYPGSRWCSWSPASVGSPGGCSSPTTWSCARATRLPAITELPSFYFHRQVFVTFIDETDAISDRSCRNRIGIENIMWSSDYPHPVSSWPNSRQVVDDTLSVLSDAERELVVAGNARRVWNL